jgi:uncharacterized protein YndB with AHSA1/START domain
VFPQPPSVVYDAWTKPEILRIWWKIGDGWITDKVEANVEVGGGFVLGATEKKSGLTHVVRGVYHEVVPSKRLVFSFEVEGEESSIHEELVTVEFSDLYGDTRMNLTHTKIRKGDPKILRTVGWEANLGQLAGYLSEVGPQK